jgi:hypothetical protein
MTISICLTIYFWFELIEQRKKFNLKIEFIVAVIDSSAKFTPLSLMDGTFVDLGNFDQCLRIKAYEETETGFKFLFNGRYCLIKFKMPLPPRKNHLKYTEKFFNYKNTSLENTVN